MSPEKVTQIGGAGQELLPPRTLGRTRVIRTQVGGGVGQDEAF